MSTITDTIVPPLREELARREERLEELRAEKAKLQEEIDKRMKGEREEAGRVRRALAALDPDYRPKPKKGKKVAKNGVGSQVVIRVGDAILKSKDRFAQREIRFASKTSPSQASGAFKLLREIGFIRKAGKVPDSTAEQWAIDDRDAFDRYKRENG